MKKIIYVLLALSLLCSADSVRAEIVAVDPEPLIIFDADTKDAHEAGEKIPMKWQSDASLANKKLDIYLSSSEKGFLYPIKTMLPVNGAFTWKIPKKTAPASDYKLFIATHDKGPSVISDYSDSFAIEGEQKNAVEIKDFSLKLSAKKNGIGKIDVKIARQNGEYMKLNVGCSNTEITLYIKDVVRNCNTWITFDKAKDKLKIAYDKRIDKALDIRFVLDLYDKNDVLIQRQYKTVNLPLGTASVAVKENPYALTINDHIRGGNINSEVRVITYSDIECPFCEQFNDTTKKLSAEFGSDIAFVHRHFPLTEIHKGAIPAAHASECVAGLNGNTAFYAFLDSAYRAPSSDLNITRALADMAEGAGVSRPAFLSCMNSGKYMSVIEKHKAQAIKLGVTGTPESFVVGANGRMETISGAQPYAVVRDLLDSFVE